MGGGWEMVREMGDRVVGDSVVVDSVVRDSVVRDRVVGDRVMVATVERGVWRVRQSTYQGSAEIS